MFFKASLLSALLVASAVSAHGTITAVKGANGVTGVGFGVTDVTGKKLRLFNQASRYIKGDTSACGSQKLDGKKQTPINQAAEFSKAIAKGVPTVAADGSISMTLFQVNGDGAGPYVCEVSADASGKKFVTMQVTKDVPGTKGKSNAKNTAFPLNVKLPKGTKCTGEKNTCLIRCKNGNSQPFGGCAVVAQGAAKRELNGRYNAALQRRRFADLLAAREEDPEDIDTDEVSEIVERDLEVEEDPEDIDTDEIVQRDLEVEEDPEDIDTDEVSEIVQRDLEEVEEDPEDINTDEVTEGSDLVVRDEEERDEIEEDLD